MMLGYEPDAARDGQEALDLLEDDGPYQLVISKLAQRASQQDVLLVRKPFRIEAFRASMHRAISRAPESSRA